MISLKRLISLLKDNKESQLERDHKLNECTEEVEISSGIKTVKRCDVCRKEMYSFSSQKRENNSSSNDNE